MSGNTAGRSCSGISSGPTGSAFTVGGRPGPLVFAAVFFGATRSDEEAAGADAVCCG